MLKRKVEEISVAKSELEESFEEEMMPPPSRFPVGFVPRKVCYDFGNCPRGQACQFAHTEDELDPAVQGEERAKFHGGVLAVEAEEGRGTSESYPAGARHFASGGRPTKLCSFWLGHPSLCSKGDQCTYAHGLVETGRTGDDLRIVTTQLVEVASAVLKTQPLQQPHASGRAGGGCTWGSAHKGGKGAFGAGVDGGMYLSGCGKSGGGNAYGADKQGFANALGNQGLPPSAHFGALPSPSDWQLPWGQVAGQEQEGGQHQGGGLLIGISRFTPGSFQPVKLCAQWLQSPDACLKGDSCTFAHGVFELQAKAAATCGVSRFLHTGFTPTKLCMHYQKGYCQKDLACTYAHLEEELQ